MQRFFRVILAAFTIFCVAGNSQIYAQDDEVKAKVELTEKQKQELSTLHKDMVEKHKIIISKYVEYGVISKEKGEIIITRLDKKYEKLEKNDFVPKWDHKKHRDKHHHYE